jgi:hypothetical protein
MASKGDIQATRSAAATCNCVVIEGPIRLRAIIIASDGVGTSVF